MTASSTPQPQFVVTHPSSTSVLWWQWRGPAHFHKCHSFSICKDYCLFSFYGFEPLRLQPLQAKHCLLVPLCHALLPVRGAQDSSLFPFHCLHTEHLSGELWKAIRFVSSGTVHHFTKVKENYQETCLLLANTLKTLYRKKMINIKSNTFLTLTFHLKM